MYYLLAALLYEYHTSPSPSLPPFLCSAQYSASSSPNLQTQLLILAGAQLNKRTFHRNGIHSSRAGGWQTLLSPLLQKSVNLIENLLCARCWRYTSTKVEKISKQQFLRMSSLSSLGPIALEQVTAIPGHWSYNEGGGEGACWRGWSRLQICAPLRLEAQTHRSLEFRVPFSSLGFSCCSSHFPSESFSLAVAATNLSIALHNTPTSRPRQSPQYETCRRIALQGARRICKALGWFEQQKILRVLQRKSTCANTLKKVRFQPKFPVFPHF